MAGAELAQKGSRVQLFLKAAFVLFIVLAAMGEWKTVNQVLEGIPKAVCVGVIFMAVAHAFIRPNPELLRKTVPPTLMYLMLIALLTMWSLAIWIMSFSDLSSVIRGGSKMIFQTISVLTAVSAVYLFQEAAVDLFTLALIITNGLIMLLEIPNYGLSESVSSLIDCIVKFGDASGFARALEIHDLTFVFGQLIIYWAVFAPKESERERKKRNGFLACCIFFFIVGMKRVAIPAVVLFAVIGAVMKRKKHSTAFFVVLGLFCTAFFLVFVYGVRCGAVSEILSRFGINMMGRDYLWSLAGSYYRFSPTFMGRGFEFVDKIVVEWYNAGIINRAYPLHNDILKVFVELGFPGFLIWSGVQYIVYPIFFLKYSDSKTAALYIAELGYMTVTYMTDNTAFYFWSTMALRLIVLAYAFYRRAEKKKAEAMWRPPSRDEMRGLMEEMLSEGR